MWPIMWPSAQRVVRDCRLLADGAHLDGGLGVVAGEPEAALLPDESYRLILRLRVGLALAARPFALRHVVSSGREA